MIACLSLTYCLMIKEQSRVREAGQLVLRQRAWKEKEKELERQGVHGRVGWKGVQGNERQGVSAWKGVGGSLQRGLILGLLPWPLMENPQERM